MFPPVLMIDPPYQPPSPSSSSTSSADLMLQLSQELETDSPSRFRDLLQQGSQTSFDGEAFMRSLGFGVPIAAGPSRFSTRLQLFSPGWTLPLWADATLSSSDIMHSPNFTKATWAWTLCGTQALRQRQQRQAQALPIPQELPDGESAAPPVPVDSTGCYGPLAWIAAWEREERHLVDSLSERDLEEFIRWYAEDFYPKVDWWRSYIGFTAEADIWDGLEINWSAAQGGWTMCTLHHPRVPGLSELAMVAEEVGQGTDTDLIRLYWVRRLWASS